MFFNIMRRSKLRFPLRKDCDSKHRVNREVLKFSVAFSKWQITFKMNSLKRHKRLISKQTYEFQSLQTKVRSQGHTVCKPAKLTSCEFTKLCCGSTASYNRNQIGWAPRVEIASRRFQVVRTSCPESVSL